MEKRRIIREEVGEMWGSRGSEVVDVEEIRKGKVWE